MILFVYFIGYAIGCAVGIATVHLSMWLWRRHEQSSR